MSPQFIGTFIGVASVYMQEQWRLIFKAARECELHDLCAGREFMQSHNLITSFWDGKIKLPDGYVPGKRNRYDWL